MFYDVLGVIFQGLVLKSDNENWCHLQHMCTQTAQQVLCCSEMTVMKNDVPFTSPNLKSSSGSKKRVICNRRDVEDCSATNATRPCCFLRKTVLEGRKKMRRRSRGMRRRKNSHRGGWANACSKHSRRYGARHTVWAPLFLFPILFYPISPLKTAGFFSSSLT